MNNVILKKIKIVKHPAREAAKTITRIELLLSRLKHKFSTTPQNYRFRFLISRGKLFTIEHTYPHVKMSFG